MDTQSLGGSILAGLIAAFVVGVGLTEVLKDVIWPSMFVGIFVGFMTGVVVFAAFYMYLSPEEHSPSRPAGGT